MENTKQHIERLVESEYKAYGFEGHAIVDVIPEEKIVLTLNHENPFMGPKFWEFLNTLHEKIEELGYKKKEGNYLSDFYIVEYVK